MGALCCLGLGGGRQGDKGQVTVVAILASEEGTSVDPRLKAIAAEVRSLNPNLKSFRLQAMTTKKLAQDEQATFALVDDKKVQVTVQRTPDAESRVELAVTPPDQGE